MSFKTTETGFHTFLNKEVYIDAIHTTNKLLEGFIKNL